MRAQRLCLFTSVSPAPKTVLTNHGYWITVGRIKKLHCTTLTLLPPINLLFDFYQSVQFSSVAQSCPTLCHPMNRSMPGLPVHHHLPEFTQTHVHRVGDAIQPSHPLSSPSPPGSSSTILSSLQGGTGSCLRASFPEHPLLSVLQVPI